MRSLTTMREVTPLKEIEPGRKRLEFPEEVKPLIDTKQTGVKAASRGKKGG